MHAFLIINPVSGDDEPNADKVPQIKRALAEAHPQLEVIYTTPERSAGTIAREAVAAGAEVVLVGGGDGTVSQVARELVKTRATLGVLPIGTFNNIARSLGLTADLDVACKVVARGHTREIDIGLANGETCFFEAAGVGLDATLFPIGEEIKGGRWSRIFSALRLTLLYRVQPIQMTFDRTVGEAMPAGAKFRLPPRARQQRSLRRNAILVVVANGPYYGGGFTIAPAARLGDGRLTLSVYRHFSKFELARHFWSISRGQYCYSPKIETYHAAEVRLESIVPLPVHVDGQPYGKLPVTLSTVPKALRVFTPDRPLQGRDPDPPVALPAAEQIDTDKFPAHAR
ncbi:MAG TPA: diacylglycerol kinase family protein [Chthoniobacteraceae bacterium]|jgi:diacylglycerol kinase (ATP)